ncbi:MAG: glycosyltransferase family 2 protein [Halobacteriaceae archaeon]
MSSSNSRNPYVVIVLLNWNNYEDTSACLKTLAEVEYSNFDVVVVDNGSDDGSGKYIEKKFPWCEVIFNDRNEGFARGNNIGIEYAQGEDADYILLLNNDTEVNSDFLSPMVEAAENNDRVGIVSGVIYDNNGDIWYAGGGYNRTFQRGKIYRSPQDSDPYETDWAYGAMMLMAAEFVEDNDIIPDEYFFGVEDADICWQARENGWKIIVAPDSKILHKVGSSTMEETTRTPFRVYHERWGELHLSKKYQNRLEQIAYLSFWLLTRFIAYPKWVKRGDLKWVHADIAAFRDWVTNSHPRESMIG